MLKHLHARLNDLRAQWNQHARATKITLRLRNIIFSGFPSGLVCGYHRYCSSPERNDLLSERANLRLGR